jgi:hypothetical protein
MTQGTKFSDFFLRATLAEKAAVYAKVLEAATAVHRKLIGPQAEGTEQPTEQRPMAQGTVFTATNGESRNPFYQGEFVGETLAMANLRRHWATAARDAERHEHRVEESQKHEPHTSGHGARV